MTIHARVFLWGQLFSFVLDTDAQAWEYWIMKQFHVSYLKQLLISPNDYCNLHYFLLVCACCMSVGVWGRLWVSIPPSNLSETRLPVVQCSHPRLAGSEALRDCLVPFPMCLRGSETADVSYKIRLYIGVQTQVLMVAQQALYPLSRFLHLHSACLPVTEGVLASL